MHETPFGSPATRRLAPEALTADGFAPFGSVVEVPATGGTPINAGTALRFDDLAGLVLTAEGGRPQLSLFRVSPARLPIACRRLERHPLSSQLFMPLQGARFLVVVAPGGGSAPDPGGLRAFVGNGRQGVNFAPGTWHHPAIALDQPTDFVVLGRAGSPDFELAGFPDGGTVEIA